MRRLSNVCSPDALDDIYPAITGFNYRWNALDRSWSTDESAMAIPIQRVIIENVKPSVDGGLYPIRRVIGDQVEVSADILVDGHEVLTGEVLFRKQGQAQWQRKPLASLGNDRWSAAFRVNEIGFYEYTVQAWINRFQTWLEGVQKKADVGQDVAEDMLEGANIILSSIEQSEPAVGRWLKEKADFFIAGERSIDKLRLAGDPDLTRMMGAHPEKRSLTSYDKVLVVAVETFRAGFSAWYELFPRSCTNNPDRHGTFGDCRERIPGIADMGFDVLYLPPIHPIGKTHRKGRNNSPVAADADPGSPWAIGGVDGGHRSLHPALGSMDEFQKLVEAARQYEMEIALDLAFQCSPDHPYVREHPEWFRKRADGSIQYAENPPKKYQDIYPFDFESAHASELCDELLGVVEFWIEQGIRIFRVDNPHTKPLAFWEWLISRIKESHPEVIFLAEAFTRPKVMQRLAKVGFTQSYTYFTWRNLKAEIEEYLTHLTGTEVAEYLWPNFWPNTPDILPEYLQLGGRPAFIVRLTLAATLSANYGIYGPAFELCENRSTAPFSEEYLDSEKYQIRVWQLDQSQNIRGMVKRINKIRRENDALQQIRNIRFHDTDCEDIICYSKYTDGFDNVILVAANLDPHHSHAAWVSVSPESLGLPSDQSFQVHDLISEARYLWHGGKNYIELDPLVMPVHVLRIRRRLRSEHDFDYFL